MEPADLVIDGQQQGGETADILLKPEERAKVADANKVQGDVKLTGEKPHKPADGQNVPLVAKEQEKMTARQRMIDNALNQV